MEYLKSHSKTLYGWKRKMSLLVCCLSILLTLTLVSTTNPGTAYADSWTLSAVSPLEQQVNLYQPSSIVPGGRGYMVPQKIVITDSLGRPVPNIPVTFEVSSTSYITSVMRGSNSKTITVRTDSNGVASAANTDPYFLGEGFQVYSRMPGIMQTLQVKASSPGLNVVTFNVKVATVGYGT
ncbi:MAG: Ig-like domain-containing protein [Clostridia bacterium]|nr:Ig-like domain-containing protein [Clostridia bacterium]